MKVKDLIEKLSKQNPENEVFFNSPVASSDANIPVGEVYENTIMMWTFSDGKIYSYKPAGYTGEQKIDVTDQIGTVLTDKIR